MLARAPPPKLELVEAEIERRRDGQRDKGIQVERGSERERVGPLAPFSHPPPPPVFVLVALCIARPANAIVEIGVDYAFAPAAYARCRSVTNGTHGI